MLFSCYSCFHQVLLWQIVMDSLIQTDSSINYLEWIVLIQQITFTLAISTWKGFHSSCDDWWKRQTVEKQKKTNMTWLQNDFRHLTSKSTIKQFRELCHDHRHCSDRLNSFMRVPNEHHRVSGWKTEKDKKMKSAIVFMNDWFFQSFYPPFPFHHPFIFSSSYVDKKQRRNEFTFR